MYRNKNYTLRSGLFLVLFIVFTIVIKVVDVKSVGPMDTKVGLATVNAAFHNLTGTNMFWYKMTEFLGIVAIAVACLYALLGLTQLLKTKKITEVDEEILCRGIIYFVVIILYVLFEKVIINYRPIIMPGEVLPEASYPSSHTMLICTIMGCNILSVGRLIKNIQHTNVIKIMSIICIVLTVFGRLVCGVHWLTDIIGGVLISCALVSAYGMLINNLVLSNKIR